ncbi:MAG TPA: anthranilate phosphoribosyltransferase [Burkholderiaceae bacterium]|nr:anthranilate phosphoribosyltransferase [Burkholderiaceae bacterium]
MTPREALACFMRREPVDTASLTRVMREILSGDVSTHLAAALLGAIGTAGEGTQEILAATRAVREALVPVVVPGGCDLVDLCGTGGDGGRTFNVSTAAAFVACAAGAQVAKHGNRSVSSHCGSADVIEALGAHIDLEPGEVAQCVRKVGMGFMFTPRHHPAMQRLGAMRRELGVRTLFNITGPLANPAGVRRQLVGVFRRSLVREVAEVLRMTGSRHVLVVHSEDGLDEISIGATTHVAELVDGVIREFDITPEDLGVPRADLRALAVDSLDDSAAMLRDALSGRAPAPRDVVALNAGAALYVAGVAASLRDGVRRALAAIESGAARAKVDQFARVTHEIGHLPAEV